MGPKQVLKLGAALALGATAVGCTDEAPATGNAGGTTSAAGAASGGAAGGASVAGNPAQSGGAGSSSGGVSGGAAGGALGGAPAAGASAGGAGAGGAAGASGGGQGGTGNVACPVGATCFDFEADQAGQEPGAPWSASPNAGAIAVDTEHAKSGSKAVHVTADHGGSSAFFSMGAPFFPPAGNEYYGRMQLWIDSLPQNGLHYTLLQSDGDVPNENFSAFYTVGGEGETLISNYDTIGAQSDCWATGKDLPLKAWLCLEWHFKGATNEIEVWVNGTSDEGAHVVGTGDGCIGHETNDIWQSPTYERLSVGYESYGNDNAAHELWIDDVAVSKTRVGCGQ